MTDPGEYEDQDFDDRDTTSDAIDTEADVSCPWCGETVTITLDPGGGSAQEYVEDCEVCCRPWLVRVTFDGTGGAEVQLEEAQ